MSARAAVGIDLGATSIKAGRVIDGRVVARARLATAGEEGAAAVLDRVAALVRSLAPRGAAVGIGSCGFVDRHGRVVSATATMPGLEGTDLPREIRRRTGCRTSADNDGNAAALGEARHGAGRGVRSVAMLTLGTGVGGGFVLDGAVVRGGGGMAATFGHLKVRRGGRRCACGARGCLEAYASAWAFRNSALRMDAKELFGAARRGEDRAGRLLDEAADALGTAFAEIAHALNPDVIVVGGGIARGWPRLRPRAIARFGEDAIPRAFASTRVVRAALGTDAGIVGAACLLDQRGR